MIPANRFSTVAKQYLALAKSAVSPESCRARAGYVGLRVEQLSLAGGTTQESTQQIQPEDRSRAQQHSHRLSYLFNRANNKVEPRDSGRRRLPVPFNTVPDHEQRRGPPPGELGLDRRSRMVNHLTVGVNTFNKDAYSPNVGQNWQDTICIPNSVDCNVNMGIISFSEFSTWGGSADNGTEQPRFSIKDDVTLSTGSHTLKAGFTFDRQQANGFGQQDIGAGPASASGNRPSRATTLDQRAARSRRSCSARRDSGRTETVRYLQQIYPYYAFYCRTTGA
jgi:hypothetical protein